MVWSALLVSCLLSVSTVQESPADAALFRHPDVGPKEIVFVYANGLWLVDRQGGGATPLANPAGEESFPKFSPDGTSIAFVGNYDGNQDIYTLPTAGGIPQRVTHHPAGETLCDWTADGRLLFYSNAESPMGRIMKLFRVGADGGLPEPLPVPYGAAGAISADGNWLAYTPNTRDSRTWKRYRGGMASDLWLFHLQQLTSRKITDWEGTDTLPMWNGEQIYYLSDGGDNAKLNIWVYDLATGRREQVTKFSEYDVKWPSIGPGDRGQGEIVFQNGSALHLLDLSDHTSRAVRVTIPGARPTVRTKSVEVAEYIQSWDISATGKRAVVQARGDIWTLPAEKGSPRNLTRSSGVAERTPSWSPDGRWVAYFSDESGEYELCMTQSDGKGETRQLTSGSSTFYYNPTWSPDSKQIAFADKAWRILVHSLESGETKVVDEDPRGFAGDGPRVRWSHDSRWITFARNPEDRQGSAIFVYDRETGDKHQVTSGVFPDSAPVFDRKGDYLYFTSGRAFSPTGSDLDDAFVYEKTGVLLAVPLLDEIEYPWLEESDEEEWKQGDEKQATEEGDQAEDEDEGDDDSLDSDEDLDEEKEASASATDDGISGTWEGLAQTPEGPLPFTVVLELHADNTVTGTLNSMMFSGDLSGSYDPDSSLLSLTMAVSGGPVIVLELKVDGSTASGTGTADGEAIPVTATRISSGGDDASSEAREAGESGKASQQKAREKVEIDIEGFERRAILLPVAKGNFHSLEVNHKNQLLYVRAGEGIKLFDINDKQKREEQKVNPAAGGFGISADGQQILIPKGRSASIQKASAGGSGKNVVTAGMTARINPKEEWRQLLTEAWRLERDFFYLENLHGVDWPAIRERYARLLEACSTREDVNFVIGEMIAELNVGHAYRSGGDLESGPQVSVGLLGVDFALDQGAYKIAKIHEGAAWDVDARNPLAQTNVEEGEYLLAVNGLPIDTAEDPWAAFTGLAGRTITLTVSPTPTLDDLARKVILKPISNEGDLRYRAWIERNRAYVEQQTDGQVGYMYVPDTGINGRNNFFRQFYSQIHRKALIVDERWNGGGYDPAVFIDALQQPITNFWAIRDAEDLKAPQAAHQGPKCILINGMAGSGGDNFPWLFRHRKVGKLIGTRTWGGLIGMFGNPGLIDGGNVTVPNFGFYETDGTWGVEGHGVDPDIEVIDDPAQMQNGADPQLDRAIELMLEEIKTYPYLKPQRPASPDRSGMGMTDADK